MDSRRERSIVPVWFGRKFEFSFPVELLPNLLARLRGTPARLEEALRGHSRETLIVRREGWSAQEHAGHLGDLEGLWLARIEDFAAGRNELTPADLTNRKTEDAGHNAQSAESVVAGFRAARSRLMARVGELDVAMFAQAIPHPRLRTPMRLIDHLYFVAEHDDHHLARIAEMTGLADFPQIGDPQPPTVQPPH